jgi:prepilin-type N-terminal cleavage/methylation domain-containing protein
MINLTPQSLLGKNKNGFTLIEILIVVLILSILFTFIALSLQPAKQRSNARNVRRKIDITNLSTAIYEYILDNDVPAPPGITTSEKQLGKCTSQGKALCPLAENSCLDLENILSKNIKTIPTDPEQGNDTTTGYSVLMDENKIITVKSCLPELGETIEFSR